MLHDELARPVVDPLLEGAAPGRPKDGPWGHWAADEGELGVEVRAHERLHLRAERSVEGVVFAGRCIYIIAIVDENLLRQAKTAWFWDSGLDWWPREGMLCNLYFTEAYMSTGGHLHLKRG